MRPLITSATLAAVVVITAQGLLAQTRMKPTAPGAAGDPVWQGVLRLTDGRTFITDGGLAIDAAHAKPATLPSREVPGKVLEDLLAVSHKEEYGFSDLSAAASGKTYTTPSGVALNATYVNFLRRVLPARSVRFRLSGGLQPIVIATDGQAIGVLMPVKQ